MRKRDATLVLVGGLALTVLVAACGRETRAPEAVSSPNHASLIWKQNVDPRTPGRRLPTAPAVAAEAVPTQGTVGRRLTTVFQTKPDASCQMAVRYVDGSGFDLLPPAIADAAGLVRWTWTPTARGTAIARVVC